MARYLRDADTLTVTVVEPNIANADTDGNADTTRHSNIPITNGLYPTRRFTKSNRFAIESNRFP
jgi:hypothetical protein